MSDITIEFEEIPVTIDGEPRFATFTVDFSYTTIGHMAGARVEEIEPCSQDVLLMLTDADGERCPDLTVHVAPERDDAARQIMSAVWSDEDHIWREAESDLRNQYEDHLESCRD